MKHIFPILLSTLLFYATGQTHAQDTAAIHQQRHLDALSVYKKNAEDYVAKNLNRFALNQLLNYNEAIDTMYKSEMDDTIKAFRINYDRSHLERSNTIVALNKQISDFKAKKEKAKTSFEGLLRKAGIASLIWLAIILILMQVRSRALKRMQAKLDTSKSQLSLSESMLAEGKELLKLAHEKSDAYKNLFTKAVDLQNIISETSLTEANGYSKEEADRLKTVLADLVRAATMNHKITATLLTQEDKYGTEKVPADLNQLCDQCFELVANGMKPGDPEQKISVSKDLEKNIPQIKIVPEAVVELLIIVLTNAFQAVLERLEKKEKGYTPKVTISTRVLPRFLQIRIHDNGDGMPDDVIESAGTPYFTLKTATHASGLGMYFAKSIAGEMHQGELKIESEPGTKTDVYIKFFTS